MVASLLSLPIELIDQIFATVVYVEDTIELQHPISVGKSIFVSPITQVCKPLREEAIRVFFLVNEFTWVMDPEEVREAHLLGKVC